MHRSDSKPRVGRVQESVPVVAGLRGCATDGYYVVGRYMLAWFFKATHDELLEHWDRASDEADSSFDIRP